MNQPLLFVLAFCAKDVDLTANLMDWIGELDPNVDHPCLLVVDSKVDPRKRAYIKLKAQGIFSHVQEIEFVEPAPPAVLKWPLWRYFANQTFLRAAQHIWANCRLPFFWMEPDAVPMHPGWLDDIAESYYGQPMRYHGPIINIVGERPAHFPKQHMAGVAVYPMTAVHTLARYCDGEHTWDLGSAADVIPQASKCRLIQHTYSPPTAASENEAWKFELRDGKLVAQGMSTSPVREDCVVFHRVKCDSLIRCLRELRAKVAQDGARSMEVIQDSFDSQITTGGIVQPTPLHSSFDIPIKRGPGRPRKLQPEMQTS
jgi:hypothetical protein